MRHTPDLHANANRVRTSTQADSHADVVRPSFGLRHDATPARTVVDAAQPTRLSQSAVTGELFAIKRILRARGKRSEHFDSHLFADPAWDILLSLARAEIEHRRTTISELCDRAHVPATTALRWINAMTIEGKLERRPDAFDRRRVYIELSRDSSLSMKAYLAEVQI
jgi:predicted glycoside hydrolase/deacetylase ChbG (UPF0249 family)